MGKGFFFHSQALKTAGLGVLLKDGEVAETVKVKFFLGERCVFHMT